MEPHQPDTSIIADGAIDNPVNQATNSASPVWADPDIGISTKAYFKTEENSDGDITETLVIRPHKEFHHLTSDNAYNASHSRSATIGPALSTRKANAKKAKEYIWNGPDRQVVRLTLTLPSLDTYQQYHPQGIDGVENDRSCRASTMKAIKTLRKDLEEKGGCIHGIFGGVEYTKENKAHINLVLDLNHPNISDFPDMKDFLANHFRNALISKSFIKVIEKSHPMPASIFSSTVEVQKVERPGYSFSDALNGAIEYVTKTDRHFAKGYQQNPSDDIPHSHQGCKFISDFSGLTNGVTREDLPADVNPYEIVQQLAAVCDEEGWVGHNNSPGQWVVQRTIPAEPAPETDSPEPETSPWLSTRIVDITSANICDPYKTDRSVTLIKIKRVAFQYLLTRQPGIPSEPMSYPLCPFMPARPARAFMTPCRAFKSLPAPVAPIASQLMPTAAPVTPVAPSVSARPRDSTGEPDEPDEPP